MRSLQEIQHLLKCAVASNKLYKSSISFSSETGYFPALKRPLAFARVNTSTRYMDMDTRTIYIIYCTDTPRLPTLLYIPT